MTTLRYKAGYDNDEKIKDDELWNAANNRQNLIGDGFLHHAECEDWNDVEQGHGAYDRTA
jgi:hypothetical protein